MKRIPGGTITALQPTNWSWRCVSTPDKRGVLTPHILEDGDHLDQRETAAVLL